MAFLGEENEWRGKGSSIIPLQETHFQGIVCDPNAEPKQQDCKSVCPCY